MTEREKILLIPELVKFEGFLKRFYSYINNEDTLTDAYEKVEAEYIEIFGQRRYSNYHSFRNVRDRKLRKPCKKK